MPKVSQRQAQYYRKENLRLMKVLSDQKNRWNQDWVSGWVNVENLTVPEVSHAKLATARLLGHALVVVPASGNEVRFYAVKL